MCHSMYDAMHGTSTCAITCTMQWHPYMCHIVYDAMALLHVVVVVVVVVVVGETVGSISSKTLAYDCLYALELCTASMIATS